MPLEPVDPSLQLIGGLGQHKPGARCLAERKGEMEIVDQDDGGGVRLERWKNGAGERPVRGGHSRNEGAASQHGDLARRDYAIGSMASDDAGKRHGSTGEIRAGIRGRRFSISCLLSPVSHLLGSYAGAVSPSDPV